MLRVLQFNGESDSVSEVSIEDMDFHKLKWLDCYNPEKEELEKIKDLVDIPENELDRCLDEDERPSITELEHFSMIVFKSPFKIGNYYSTTSLTVLISDNLLVTFRRKAEINAMNDFWKSEEKSKVKGGLPWTCVTCDFHCSGSRYMLCETEFQTCHATKVTCP